MEGEDMNKGRKFAWRGPDGRICQTHIATTKDNLFEMTGFGAVDVDKPLKGFLAVQVTRDDDYGTWREVRKEKK